MRVFRDLDHYDEQFPAFLNRKKELHETEEGQREMSKEMQLVIAEERRDAEAIGEAKGILKGIAKGEIKGTVKSMRVDGKSDQEIIDRLIMLYNLSEKDAGEALAMTV
ncbi:MAG: hypothetical protein IJ088_11995 [Clostridia bacterium]|nr:hypothetical protein [Clostridia bacterium]